MRITIETAQSGIAEFRQKNGYTLDKLSEKTGVAKSTLIKIEAGSVKPQATTVYKLNQHIKTVEPCTEAM